MFEYIYIYIKEWNFHVLSLRTQRYFKTKVDDMIFSLRKIQRYLPTLQNFPLFFPYTSSRSYRLPPQVSV